MHHHAHIFTSTNIWKITVYIKSGDTLFGKVSEKATELIGQTPEVRQKAIENLLKEILK